MLIDINGTDRQQASVVVVVVEDRLRQNNGIGDNTSNCMQPYKILARTCSLAAIV